MLSGIRWPGTRRSRTLIWALDATADVLAKPPAYIEEAEEVWQLSRLAGRPAPDDAQHRLPDGPPMSAALDGVQAQGWVEHPSRR